MSHVLTSADLEQASQAIEVLTSPLEHPSVDDWRSAVNTQLRTLLHADSAGFLLPVPDSPLVYSDEHDAEQLAAYADYPPPPISQGRPAWEAMVRKRVFTLETLYEEDVGGYLNSAYYNEYAGANAAHDPVGMSLTLGEMDIREVASLQFWHERPDGRRFGDRETALMRLLYPAFESGVRTALRTMCDRAALMTQLEGQRDGAFVFDLEGRLIHRNAAVSGMVWTPREERTLIAAARELACGLDTDRILGGTTLTSRVPVRSGELVLRAIRMSPGLLGPGAGVLVTVEPAGAAPPELSLLREEFGLTRRQAQVALLLDQRKSNAEIAGLLGISPHTARRHTEAVMGKLGVTDRREVHPMLSRMEQECQDLDPATNERLSA